MAGLLDLFTDQNAQIPPGAYGLLGALANSNPGASRLPISGGQILANMAGGFAGGLGEAARNRYTNTLASGGEIQNQLANMTLEGYRKMQRATGAAPTKAGAISSSMGGPTPSGTPGFSPSPLYGPVAGMTVAQAMDYFKNPSSAQPIPNAPKDTSVTPSPIPNANPGPINPANFQPVPQSSQQTASSPRPLFDVPSLMQQYRIAAATPGMQSVAQGLLGLLQKGVPEGMYMTADGSLANRPGLVGSQFDQERAKALAKPVNMRAGGAVVDPATGQVIAQSPVRVDTVDPRTGATYATFQTPPITTSRASGVPNGVGISGGPQKLPQLPPVGGVSSPPPAGNMIGLGPKQKASLEKTGGELADFGTALRNDSVMAIQNNFLIDQMRNEAKTWQQGAFADAEGSARKYLQGFAQSFGIKAPELDSKLADYQAFSKNAMELTRQVVRQTSSRAAVQEFQMIQKALPSANMSEGGFNKIADQLQALNDYRIAKNAFADQWRARPNGDGTLDGFEAAWNQTVTPSAFVIKRMSDADLTKLRDTLSKSPEGQVTLKNLAVELQRAQKAGVLQ